MKYKERDRAVQELRELADFLEARGHMLPGWTSITTRAMSYLTATDYSHDEKGDYVTTLNEPETKQNLRRFLEAVGTCEKDYRDDSITITKMNSLDRTMVRGTVDRSVACRKKVVGTKLVQATFLPARIEEEVEWVCDDGLSLLSLVKDT